VPTSKVVLDAINSKIGDFDFEPSFECLQIEKGGTSTSGYTHDNGIIRIFTDDRGNQVFDSVESIDWTEVSNVPDATTFKKGIIKLNDSFESASMTEAPTANALNKVYKLITQDSDQTAYVKKSGDIMTGTLETPEIVATSGIINEVVSDNIDTNSVNSNVFMLSNSAAIMLDQESGGMDFVFNVGGQAQVFKSEQEINVIQQKRKKRREDIWQ
jgi:phage-related tail fiber protein